MKNYDLIVIGGGWSGVASAIAASRQGLKTLIIEKSSSLGGSATVNFVNPFMPYKTVINGKETLLSDGIFTEIRENLFKNKGILDKNGSTFNQETLKFVLDKMCLENNVETLFHSTFLSANYDSKINSITVLVGSSIYEFSAKVFIDATGNGEVFSSCKLPYCLGRESDSNCQPMTLCFWLSNVDVDEAFKNKNYINEKYQEFKKIGKISNPREDILFFHHIDHNILHFNSTRIIKLNPIDGFDKSKAEIEARKQINELILFLKENFACFKNSILLASAPEIGIRESRKLDGEYKITIDDILNHTKFYDGIAACNYDIDIHNPDGSGTSHHYFNPGEFYSIPYRCTYNKKLSNLLVTGRCISGTFEAEASYRIIPTVTSLGEATGIAASLMVKNNVSNYKVDTNELRKLIKKNNFID